MTDRYNPFKNAAEALWQLLDDIDTLDDSCRDDDAAFRARVRAVQKKREAWAVSPDGQQLVWNVLDWRHWFMFGSHELHYAGQLRAKVSKHGPATAGADPTYVLTMGGRGGTFIGNVSTTCNSLDEAIVRAERQVRCDADVPEVPGGQS